MKNFLLKEVTRDRCGINWLLKIVVFTQFFITYSLAAPAEGSSQVECTNEGCVNAASHVLELMDRSVDPCEDFYQFACGGIVKQEIPDDTSMVNTFENLRRQLLGQLRRLVESNNIEDDDVKVFKSLKQFYSNCMDIELINQLGHEPILNMLKVSGEWPILVDEYKDDFNWVKFAYAYYDMGFDINYFIRTSLTFDYKNTTRYIISIDSAELYLERSFLSNGFSDKNVGLYFNFMVDVAVILGANKDRALTELKEALEFEIELAKISPSKEARRNSSAGYNLLTIAELNKKYPTIPWLEYLHRVFKLNDITENEEIVIESPDYLVAFEQLVQKTPKNVVANYAMWRLVADMSPYHSEDIDHRHYEYKMDLQGMAKQEPRWRKCIRAVSSSLSLAAGALYVKTYFLEEAKKNVDEMVVDIRASFKNALIKAEWMDEKTKSNALDKFESMQTHMAYPVELLDKQKLNERFEGLEIHAGSYFDSIKNITKFNTMFDIHLLRKPVNKTDWTKHGSAAVVNAFYSPIENSIQFPAGILQGAFFNLDRPNYMNYGGIGYVIGHEISHGFDDHGRQFDKDGNLAEWWEPSTKAEYMKRAQCIIDQYGNYTVESVGLNLNGFNTQGENIADNVGVYVAYQAYQERQKRNGIEPPLPGLPYTPQQMFWISAANIWCSKYRPERLKELIITNVHSPSMFRVIGPFSNAQVFASDFNCPVGSKMNPEKKCAVW